MSEVSGAYEDGARTLPRDAPARRGSPPPTAVSPAPVSVSLPETARRSRRLAAGRPPYAEGETPLERLAAWLTSTPTLATLLMALLVLLAVLF